MADQHSEPGDPDAPTRARPSPDAKSNVSRRTLFKAGAGVAGVAGAAAVTGGNLPAAFAAGKPRTDQNGGAAGRSPASIGGAAALPPLLPGATVAQRGWANFRVSATTLDPLPVTLYETYGLVYDGNGPSGSFTETELALPSHAMLARVDVYGKANGANSQLWTVYNQVVGEPDQTLGSFGDINTDQGPGVVHGVGDYTGSPHHIEPGEIVNVALQDSSADSAANGVIYQYYEKGALVLIDPVRVYDSRPGNPPGTGPKTRLTAVTPRPIDCSSAVPTGSKGALLNVTAVNTGPAGWIVVFKNGIATPFVSSVNWNGAGQVAANSVITEVDAASMIAVVTNTNTDFIIDVLGYIP